MTQLILGPGALGRLLALRLSPQEPVRLLGRRPLPARLGLTTPEGETWHREITSAPNDAPLPTAIRVLHLTTKAMAAEAALASVAPRLPPRTPLVLWQNGYDVQPRLHASWTGPVLCASTSEGAYVVEDGVVHAGHGQTWLGSLDGRHIELARELAAVLDRAGLPATAVSDIRQRLWQKLAVNAAINPLVARFGIRNGQLRDRPFRPMVTAMIEELAPILAAEEIPAPESGWAALVWGVIEGTANNRASMLQDISAGRPTERDAILGPLLAAARRHGLAHDGLLAAYHGLDGLPQA
ncbi:ketopantoate reductase family protein [Halomonas sp. 328]|uniref:ketopantoate reductase family protein n=1 Tax=Halomonas sp. 328 TaxID=2776704 RepID=UPI0018A7A7A7|nr:2-dehydropantoate 2-reductase [Halomonas sp. 328]MBF8221125.1 2-dehydropantoate 2-reductase [Halomonas sp. 328]